MVASYSHYLIYVRWNKRIELKMSLEFNVSYCNILEATHFPEYNYTDFQSLIWSAKK